jgi:hypothetical protein
MDSAHTSGLMEEPILDNGRMENNMVKADIFFHLVKKEWVFGLKGNAFHGKTGVLKSLPDLIMRKISIESRQIIDF